MFEIFDIHVILADNTMKNNHLLDFSCPFDQIITGFFHNESHCIFYLIQSIQS